MATIGLNEYKVDGYKQSVNPVAPNRIASIAAASNKQDNTPSQLDIAQKAYDDAIARRNEVNNAAISSYQDIINRYGPPETAEDAAVREKKEKNKRDLLALIQLGANIGNMANATTGGKMGGRSVETPNLVTSYDKARENELTHRMKRDEKRNAARQAMLNLKNQASTADVNAAASKLAYAQKSELQQKNNEASMQKEMFKAANDERNRREQREFDKYKFDKTNSLNWSKHNSDKRYKERMLDVREESNRIREKAIELSKNGKKGKTIPIKTPDNKVYDIPVDILNDPTTAGDMYGCLPPKYKKDFDNALDIKSKFEVIGKYISDQSAHQGVVGGNDYKVMWGNFNTYLEAASGKSVDDIYDLNDDLNSYSNEDNDSEIRSLFEDMTNTD